jgi:hypothetical protein
MAPQIRFHVGLRGRSVDLSQPPQLGVLPDSRRIVGVDVVATDQVSSKLLNEPVGVNAPLEGALARPFVEVAPPCQPSDLAIADPLLDAGHCDASCCAGAIQ